MANLVIKNKNTSNNTSPEAKISFENRLLSNASETAFIKLVDSKLNIGFNDSNTMKISKDGIFSVNNIETSQLNAINLYIGNGSNHVKKNNGSISLISKADNMVAFITGTSNTPKFEFRQNNTTSQSGHSRSFGIYDLDNITGSAKTMLLLKDATEVLEDGLKDKDTGDSLYIVGAKPASGYTWNTVTSSSHMTTALYKALHSGNLPKYGLAYDDEEAELKTITVPTGGISFITNSVTFGKQVKMTSFNATSSTGTSYTYALTVRGNLTVNADTILAKLTAGETSLSSLSVTNNTQLSGSLTVGKNTPSGGRSTTLYGNLTVGSSSYSKSTTLNGSLTVSGTSIFNGSTQFNKRMRVTGWNDSTNDYQAVLELQTGNYDTCEIKMGAFGSSLFGLRIRDPQDHEQGLYGFSIYNYSTEASDFLITKNGRIYLHGQDIHLGSKVIYNNESYGTSAPSGSAEDGTIYFQIMS